MFTVFTYTSIWCAAHICLQQPCIKRNERKLQSCGAACLICPSDPFPNHPRLVHKYRPIPVYRLCINACDRKASLKPRRCSQLLEEDLPHAADAFLFIAVSEHALTHIPIASCIIGGTVGCRENSSPEYLPSRQLLPRNRGVPAQGLCKDTRLYANSALNLLQGS